MASSLAPIKELKSNTLTTLFFRAKNNVECADVAVGESMPGAEESAHRAEFIGTKGFKGGDPIVSRVGRVMDHIFEKKLTLKTDGRMTMFAQEGYEVPVLAKMVGDKINLSYVNETGDEEKENDYHILYAAFIVALSKDIELKGYFDEAVEEYRDMGICSSYIIASLSDSFYYGWIKSDKINLDACTRFNNFKMAMFDPATANNVDLGIDDFLGEVTAPAPKPKKARAKKVTSSLIDKANEYRKIIGSLIDKGIFSWEEKVADKIPAVEWLDKFEPTEQYEMLCNIISSRLTRIAERLEKGLSYEECIGNDVMNFLFLGKPGTGKTFLAFAIAATFGLPVASTIWSKNSEEEEEEGKTRIVEGNPGFIETDGLLLHKYGGLEILEEINLAPASVVTGVLNQKLEYPYIIKENGYDTQHRNPFNIAFATMNVGTNGSNAQNAALINRFECVLADDPSDAEAVAILAKKAGVSVDRARFVWDCYGQVTTFLSSPSVGEETVAESLSMRNCCQILKQLQDGLTIQQAFLSFAGAIAAASGNVELARMTIKDKIAGLPTGIPE